MLKRKLDVGSWFTQEAITESFPVLTGVSVDGAYQYHDLSEIIGQTSNPNIFKTNDSETPFLYFGEDGFVPCEVEITEYPILLTLGGVTVSDVYQEYSYAGEMFYPSTQTGGGLLAGALFDIYPDRHELRAIHKVGDEIICELTHYGIHDLVIYHIDQKSFTSFQLVVEPTFLSFFLTVILKLFILTIFNKLFFFF